jgi:prepilin-type N-terminal cleavage/methylation domain-containing protein/prepilin-type processing-associated H-X9-DG protein
MSYRRAPGRAGFTLVELLVVIGIIALLIAILLPALSRAREQANLIKCMATLRGMAQAAHAHAAEHQGYMPFAGQPPGGPGGIPVTAAGLGDSNRMRYLYVDDSVGPRPLPLTMSLAYYMGVPMNMSSRSEVLETLKTQDLQRPFICPSHQTRLPSWTIYGSPDGWIKDWGNEYSSYICNGAVLSLYPTPFGLMSPAGKLSRIRRPSEVFLFADGVGTSLGSMGYTIQPVRSDQDTFYNYWVTVKSSGGFDPKRHRNKMNVVYVDGHAETVTMARSYYVGPNNDTAYDHGDFDRIGISKGIFD